MSTASKWSKFKSMLFNSTSSKDDDSSSIEGIATVNALDRRKHARIQYPQQGIIRILPQIYFNEKELQGFDISLGGLCVIDRNDELESTVGNSVTLHLRWKDFEVDQECVTVQAVDLKRHLQFKEIKTEVFVRLNFLLKPGYVGMKMRKVHIEDATNLEVEADEIWIGVTGESLIFNEEPDETGAIGELTIYNRNLTLFKEFIPVFSAKKASEMKGQRIPNQLLNEVIIFLANIKNPTQNIKDLQKSLIQLESYDSN